MTVVLVIVVLVLLVTIVLVGGRAKEIRTAGTFLTTLTVVKDIESAKNM